MNERARIGELLRKMVPLSRHDVEEILHEQMANPRRFGDIALDWGLCQPEHVWRAWVQQAHGSDTVDLEKIGVDARAAAMLPADVARAHQVIPLRVAGDAMLMATANGAGDHAQDLSALVHRKVIFVRAQAAQVEGMIKRYYPPTETH
jgi:hypothetical protein